MPFTREDLRASFENAEDESWRTLVRHHEDAYPNPRPTPGDVARREAERLNEMGYGGGDYELVESHATRPNDHEVTVVHRLRSKTDGREIQTEPFTGYGE